VLSRGRATQSCACWQHVPFRAWQQHEGFPAWWDTGTHDIAVTHSEYSLVTTPCQPAPCRPRPMACAFGGVAKLTPVTGTVPASVKGACPARTRTRMVHTRQYTDSILLLPSVQVQAISLHLPTQATGSGDNDVIGCPDVGAAVNTRNHWQPPAAALPASLGQGGLVVHRCSLGGARLCWAAVLGPAARIQGGGGQVGISAQSQNACWSTRNHSPTPSVPDINNRYAQQAALDEMVGASCCTCRRDTSYTTLDAHPQVIG
jgi:hypothetical protein